MEQVSAFSLKAGQLKQDGLTSITADEAAQFNANIPDFFSDEWDKRNNNNVIKAYLVASISSTFALLFASKAYQSVVLKVPDVRLIPNVPVGLALFCVAQYCGIEAALN